MSVTLLLTKGGNGWSIREQINSLMTRPDMMMYMMDIATDLELVQRLMR